MLKYLTGWIAGALFFFVFVVMGAGGIINPFTFTQTGYALIHIPRNSA